MTDETSEDREALAAEYALGSLDAATRAAVAARLRTDAALRARVAEWERRLAPLAEDVQDIAPPPWLWRRIAAAIEPPAPFWQRISTWRWATAAAGLAATLLLVLLILGPERHDPPEPIVALLSTPAPQPAWAVSLSRDGRRLTVQPLARGLAVADRSLELWLLPPGGAPPRSLGLIAAAAPTTLALSDGLHAAITHGAGFAVSLEPPGGSPGPGPSGPVLYQGAAIGSG